jgi:hypothetical protein
MYISDKDRLSACMGQFQLWEGKLFYYSDRLGWRYIR